ncbi:MAG TPA: 50S ribosomal protein L23 [Candidatus Hydrogenedentes bacterium]|nr:50S ribosomal protein L23 [Candidatus Hydrogenedentota bacterium]HPO86448.1 50S ribosomal protein L23 [Candidatus Hydrogenedentota bacterium]
MKSEPIHIVKSPVLTEESTIQTDTLNKYTFKVDPRATKAQIRDAVEKLFNVRVTSVNTMNYMGKVRRRGRIEGRRAAWKKAVVTLREGDSIELI